MGMTCTWEPDPACLGDKWDALEESVKERSLMLATSTLMALTNNRVGTCPITIRPCPEAKPCGCWGESPGYAPGWNPINWAGQWFNCLNCGSRCKPVSEVDLPGPVGYIDSIRVDGEEIDLADFRLDNGHILVWQGSGPSPIPSTQNLNLPDTAPGTWSITYSRSYPVLADARLAVATLALEYAEACKPKGKCSLPRGVTNVVRNGVTFTVDAGLFINGLTGIEVVDAFILKWAPAGSPTSNASVFNPRKAPLRRTSTLPVRRKPPVTTEYRLTFTDDDLANWEIDLGDCSTDVIDGRFFIQFPAGSSGVRFTYTRPISGGSAVLGLDVWADQSLNDKIGVGLDDQLEAIDARLVSDFAGTGASVEVERGPILLTGPKFSVTVSGGLPDTPCEVMIDNLVVVVSEG